jgi:hypothetical protein
LVRRRQVGLPQFRLLFAEVADGVEERGLEPGEREVEPRYARHRERECVWIAIAREAVDLGTARVVQAEQASALVERLAGGVVERRPESRGAAALRDFQQQRVPAACEQADERRL